MKLKYSGILILGIGIAFLYLFINPKDVSFFPKCPLYLTTGIYCPGCGSQRAIHHLLNFNFLGVIQQNMLFVFGLIFLSYHFTINILNSVFNKNYYNYLNHTKTPLIILAIVLLFWIIRNIPMYPFNLLAPK
jgi:hypothetical protein